MSIESVYGSLLGRSPDEGAYGTYAGWSDDDIANAIYGSEEYANLQNKSTPQAATQETQSSGGGGLSVGEIDSIYQQYLGRNADPSGLATYAGWSAQDIANALRGSPEFAQRQASLNKPSTPTPVAPTPATPAYKPAASTGEYNFAMTGKPTDVELATNPDMANAWYAYSGTSPAPAANTWETAPDFAKNSPAAISHYNDSGLTKPFSTTDIQAAVDPSTIRIGYNNTPYAGVKSNVPGLISGGEYVVNPQTGKFVLDANGNPTPVPLDPNKGKSGTFDTIMETAIPAFIAAAAVPVLGGLAGQALGGLGATTGAATGAAEGVAGGTTTGTGLTSTGSGYAGVGLNPAIQTGGELAYSGVGLNPAITGGAGVGLNAAIPGITSGLATSAGSLAAASGIPITADIFGAAGGLTAAQSAALDAALTAGDYATASSLVPAGSTLAKLLAPAVKAIGTATTANKAAQTSSLLPNLLRQGTGGGSAQAALPGIYREPFNPFAFGNQQPTQGTVKGFDFLSALNKEGQAPSAQASSAQPSSATARNQLLANLLF